MLNPPHQHHSTKLHLLLPPHLQAIKATSTPSTPTIYTIYICTLHIYNLLLPPGIPKTRSPERRSPERRNHELLNQKMLIFEFPSFWDSGGLLHGIPNAGINLFIYRGFNFRQISEFGRQIFLKA